MYGKHPFNVQTRSTFKELTFSEMSQFDVSVFAAVHNYSHISVYQQNFRRPKHYLQAFEELLSVARIEWENSAHFAEQAIAVVAKKEYCSQNLEKDSETIEIAVAGVLPIEVDSSLLVFRRSGQIVHSSPLNRFIAHSRI